MRSGTFGPVLGRSGTVKHVHRALVRRETSGVLIVGKAGIGKTELARDVVQFLRPTHHVIFLRGSRVAAQAPYGALVMLLSDVSERILDHPTRVMQVVTEVIERDAAGRPAVVFVDNAGQLDPLAALVVTQLAYAGTIQLIATLDDLTIASNEFFKLWTDGNVLRVDPGPLTFAEADELVAGELGGPVGSATLRILNEATGGNPLLLRMLVRHQVDAGTLSVHTGTWLLTQEVAYGGIFPDLFGSVLAKLTPSQFAAAELIALGGELPAQTVRILVDDAELDALEEMNLIEIVGDDDPRIRMRTTIIGEVVRARVPPGRTRDLYRRVLAALDPQSMSPTQLLRVATWSLQSGMGLDAAQALKAATTANRLLEPARALEFIAAAKGRSSRLGLELEKCRALILQARVPEAKEVLDRCRLNSASTEQRVRYHLMRCRVLREFPSGAASARLAVEQAAEAFYQDFANLSDDQRAAMFSIIALTAAELADFEGRYSDVLELVAGLATHRDAEVRLRAGSLAFEAMAMLGNHPDATRGLKTLIDKVKEGTLGGPALPRAVKSLLWGLIAMGQFERCGEILDLTGTGGVPMVRGTAGTDAVRGIVHALRGESEQSLKILIPATAELRQFDPRGMLQPSLAARAAMHRLEGAEEEAHEILVELDGFSGRQKMVSRQATDFFAINARHGSDHAVAIRELCAAAERAQNGEAPALSAYFRVAAMWHGDVRSAQWLTETRTFSGTFAEQLEAFALGLLNDDPAMFYRSAQLADRTGSGGGFYTYTVAERAYRLAAQTGDRTIMNQARKLSNSAFHRLRQSNRPAELFKRLNPFEQELTSAAGKGATSGELASRFTLSPRTVDWHLSRIFRTLHVSNRSELRDALAVAGETGDG